MWEGLDEQLYPILMMGTELVPETSVIFNQLTRLIAREDFINVMKCSYCLMYATILKEAIRPEIFITGFIHSCEKCELQ
jgi:hypothetical protein